MKKGPQYQQPQTGVKNTKHPMKQCAVALKGMNNVFTIDDYSEWLKNGNKEDVIVFEDCDKDRLKEKYLYWEHTINYKKYAID